MEKIYGATERHDGIQQIGLRRWEIFYGYGVDELGAYNYRQTLEHKPDLVEVKEIVLGQINSNVQEKILQGLTYHGYMVWLSAENQRNITLAYAMARGRDLTTMPVIKLGTDEDSILYEFEDAGEVIAFSTLVEEHISDCLAEGRQEKGDINWDDYVI